ncbi:MAG: putative ABC transport system ATP-binding protein [Oleiphilaceae bacterium]|jgi:putative ABC transport system ATP-binding protein
MSQLVQENLLLKLTKLSKTVKSGLEDLNILQGIDLEIKQGESVAIIGASGSGKSTLLGIIAGLDSASSGESWLLGHALHNLDEDQRAAVRSEGVGFVFQNFQLLPGLNALENVSLPIEITGQYSLKEAQVIAKKWLEKVGLGKRYHHYPKQLSGGEQQRVAIARAFAAQPKVLFADEPTGNLDSHTGEQIIQILFELNQSEQTTLVLVTHDNALAQSCQRILTMIDGHLHEKKLDQKKHQEKVAES